LLESLFIQAQSSPLQKRREEGNTNQHKAMRQQGNEIMRREVARQQNNKWGGQGWGGSKGISM